MTQFSKITDKILHDAEHKASIIINNAKITATGIEQKATDEANQKVNEIKQNAQTKILDIESKYKTAILMEEKKSLLKLKVDLVDTAFLQAKKKLCNLSQTEYLDMLRSILKNLHLKDTAYLIYPKKYTLHAYANELGALNILLSDEDIQLEGGFIIKAGDIEYNYTPSAVLNEKKEQLYDEVVNILF